MEKGHKSCLEVVGSHSGFLHTHIHTHTHTHTHTQISCLLGFPLKDCHLTDSTLSFHHIQFAVYQIRWMPVINTTLILFNYYKIKEF